PGIQSSSGGTSSASPCSWWATRTCRWRWIAASSAHSSRSRSTAGSPDGGTMPDLTLAAALLAGLVSFLSPCVLPVVPAYLGQLGAIAVATPGTDLFTDGGRRW